ncbi:hypothetical protein [Candidatus Methylocalor cossyra]|uniref:Transposase IS4-like domain-containing protein n=1 Tax=Candidatus Methylocalor cossyra TaxID=3108543 RepID=A0ABM9NMZ6_9GAMM
MVARSVPEGGTVAADKGYDRADFIAKLKDLGANPKSATGFWIKRPLPFSGIFLRQGCKCGALALARRWPNLFFSAPNPGQRNLEQPPPERRRCAAAMAVVIRVR